MERKPLTRLYSRAASLTRWRLSTESFLVTFPAAITTTDVRPTLGAHDGPATTRLMSVDGAPGEPPSGARRVVADEDRG